jgi:hypothetical protein
MEENLMIEPIEKLQAEIDVELGAKNLEPQAREAVRIHAREVAVRFMNDHRNGPLPIASNLVEIAISWYRTGGAPG